MIEKLGVDIWGVIRKLRSFKGEMIPGAFPALRQLVDKRFGENVWLVSIGQTGKGTLRWLEKQNFYEETSILPRHVKFCRALEKASFYDNIRATHVIDDNDFVLAQLTITEHRYLFKTEYSLMPRFSEEKLSYDGTPIQIVTSWEQVLNMLLPKEAE